MDGINDNVLNLEVDESRWNYQTDASFAQDLQHLKKTDFQKSSLKKNLLKRVHLSTFFDYLRSNPRSCSKAKNMAHSTKMDIKWRSLSLSLSFSCSRLKL